MNGCTLAAIYRWLYICFYHSRTVFFSNVPFLAKGRSDGGKMVFVTRLLPRRLQSKTSCFSSLFDVDCSIPRPVLYCP